MKMDTSEKTETDGLETKVPTAEEEISPTETSLYKSGTSIRSVEYIPQTMQESLEDRASKSQVETDRVARYVLIGCLILIGASHIAQLVAGWMVAPVFPDGADKTLDTIKYVATIIMGYLFGKSASKMRDN